MSTPIATLSDEPANAPTAAIDVRGLKFAYADRAALEDVSLSVPRGAIFGLLGPNGCGKSTLISVLIGRQAAASGGFTLLGEPLSPGTRQCVGIVFQEPSLDAAMTVRETMHLQGRMFGIERGETARRTALLLERMNLGDRAASMTGTLSGGMKRRLELARALVPRPELILLDEPTLALDVESRHDLWRHLLEENARGVTLLLATNDVHEAEQYCHSIALMDHGRIVTEGAPSALKRSLKHDAVRIEWRTNPTPWIAVIETMPGAGEIRLADRTTHVTVDAASPFLARLFAEAGDHIHSVVVEQTTLEDVYFQLVGRTIAQSGDEPSEPL